ncbi:hypothetical protein H8356DRAFT_1356893 [Neocallimastix lanati (nom. inval.)]|nr:hypothetical protein H8356DRAFT_1356893 [Neocallimastix sp. JGI-2020a]
MQLGEMQHFNNTPLGEMQSGEMQLSLFPNISTNFSCSELFYKRINVGQAGYEYTTYLLLILLENLGGTASCIIAVKANGLSTLVGPNVVLFYKPYYKDGISTKIN